MKETAKRENRGIQGDRTGNTRAQTRSHSAGRECTERAPGGREVGRRRISFSARRRTRLVDTHRTRRSTRYSVRSRALGPTTIGGQVVKTSCRHSRRRRSAPNPRARVACRPVRILRYRTALQRNVLLLFKERSAKLSTRLTAAVPAATAMAKTRSFRVARPPIPPCTDLG